MSTASSTGPRERRNLFKFKNGDIRLSVSHFPARSTAMGASSSRDRPKRTIPGLTASAPPSLCELRSRSRLSALRGGGQGYGGPPKLERRRMARRWEFSLGAHSVMIDGYLVAATVFSLGLASFMAVITWRVIRLGRPQTAAGEDSGPRVARRRDEPADTVERPTWPPARRDIENRRQALPRRTQASRS